MKRIHWIALLLVIFIALVVWWFQTKEITYTHKVVAKPLPPPAASQQSSPVPNGDTPENAPMTEVRKLADKLMVLRAGGVEMPLSFEDNNVSSDLQLLIVDDLNLVYGHLKTHEMLAPVTGGRRLRIQGNPTTLTGLINFTGEGRYFPSELQENLGHLIQKNGQQHLVVSHEIIAAYETAHVRMTEHREAFEALPHFIEMLNRLADVPPINTDELLFVVASPSLDEAAVKSLKPSQIVQGFGNKNYRMPSILEIKESPDSRPELRGFLVAPLYFKQGGGISNSAPPIIFHKGRWKLLIGGTP